MVLRAEHLTLGRMKLALRALSTLSVVIVGPRFLDVAGHGLMTFTSPSCFSADLLSPTIAMEIFDGSRYFSAVALTSAGETAMTFFTYEVR